MKRALRWIVLPDWVVVDTAEDVDLTCSVTGSVEHGYQVYCGDQVEAWPTSYDELIRALKKAVHLQIAARAPDLVFIHSGVVLTEYGLLLLPGKSHTGKSTLVRELVRLGGRYFSDEYAVVCDQGLVRPFPRAHSHRLTQGRVRYTPAEDLGWSSDFGPEPVSAVLVLQYHSGSSWSPVSLSKGETILRLLENTVCIRERPRKALAHIVAAASSTIAATTSRGEAQATAVLVMEWLERSSLWPDVGVAEG